MAGVGTTHHIKLGDEYLIVRPNTYSKMPAPTFGARISSGDPDYNNLSIWQHWVQKCWVGGIGADEWVDDAMLKESVGFDTTLHEKATLSRHLKRGTGAGWDQGASGLTVTGGRFIVYHGRLYCLTTVDDAGTAQDSRLYVYTAATQTWSGIAMPGNSFVANAVLVYDGKFFVGGSSTGGVGGTVLYWAGGAGTGDLPASPSWQTPALPAGETGVITAMGVYNSKMYVAFSTTVWRMTDTQAWDGSTAFYKATTNSGSNEIRAMETHLGFLYMLSSNGHLHRTDGNNTFDIWSWDGQSMGVSLRSYDGKLFVGTYEFTDTPDVGYGVLYQFTGAAVTELKRWGVQGRATTIGAMCVYARRLYYGASGLFGTRQGFGIACYDSVEDGHSIFAMNDNVGAYPDASGVGRAWCVDDVFVFNGQMFCYVRGWGVFFTPDSFKDVEKGLARFSTSVAGGTMTSSLYDGGTPGLQKMWRRVTVWADLPALTSMTVAYSVDAGVTWVQFPNVSGPQSTRSHDFFLNNIRSAQFQWRVTFFTADETKTPTLRGVSVAYLPQPEPNWMWTFVIPVADKWELQDGTIEVKDTNALIAYIEGLFRSQQLVQFIDIDGVPWAQNGPGVLLYDMNVMHYDIDQPREADMRMTLLETVETY